MFTLKKTSEANLYNMVIDDNRIIALTDFAKFSENIFYMKRVSIPRELTCYSFINIVFYDRGIKYISSCKVEEILPEAYTNIKEILISNTLYKNTKINILEHEIQNVIEYRYDISTIKLGVRSLLYTEDE